MATETLRYRGSQAIPEPNPDLGAGTAGKAQEPHPAGDVKHGPVFQLIRMLLLATWFNTCIGTLSVTQFIGSPLYFYDKNYFYAYMAYTKQSFGVVLNTISQWFSPTLIRVSWEPSLKGQFKRTENGRLESSFPERLVLIANHQIYTDWLYLWWFAYTSKMHGHLFIILKESLKYIPLLGPGMMFFGFVFMARKWSSDKPRLQHRLQKLSTQHAGPMAGSPAELDPMWLLVFPEGTNLSANTRKRSLAWATKQGIDDLKYQLLPRSTGLQFCLAELKGTAEYMYDCTIAYEGMPKDGYAQDFFTLRSLYFQGRPPKSVNMYWRRFAVADIPLDDHKIFDQWLVDRWREKDELLQQYYDTGRFPAGTAGIDEKHSDGGYINTEVCLRAWWEIGQIFVVLLTCALFANIATQLYTIFSAR